MPSLPEPPAGLRYTLTPDHAGPQPPALVTQQGIGLGGVIAAIVGSNLFLVLLLGGAFLLFRPGLPPALPDRVEVAAKQYRAGQIQGLRDIENDVKAGRIGANDYPAAAKALMEKFKPGAQALDDAIKTYPAGLAAALGKAADVLEGK